MENVFWNSYNKYKIDFKRTYFPALKCVCAAFYNKQT